MERLVIRHFGPVKDLKVDILPLTLFIGTQGSGKSTVSKVITVCRDMNWILSLLKKTNHSIRQFAKFSIDEYFYEDTYIEYEAENELGHYIIKHENGSFSISVLNRSEEDMIRVIHAFLFNSNRALLTQLGVTDFNVPVVMEKYGDIIQSNARTILYVPAERNLAGTLSASLASMIAAQVPLYDALLEYMSVFEKAKHALKDYEVPFLNTTFTIKEGKERIRFVDNKDGSERFLSLQACSSGLQSVLPLVMVIDYALKLNCFNSFVIEEPEQNLFPSNQRELLHFLLSRFGSIDNSIITTHSPYILSCLNVVLLASRIRKEFSNSAAELSNVYDGVYMDYDSIAVYSLDPDDEEYCKNLKNERTGLIGINHLDVVSDVIGEDYDRIYKLYLKLKRS